MTKQNKETEKREVDYVPEGCKGLTKKLGIFFNKITYPNGKIKPFPALIGLYIVGALGLGGSILVHHTIDYIKNNKNKSPIIKTEYGQPHQYLQKDSIGFSNYTFGRFNYYLREKK